MYLLVVQQSGISIMYPCLGMPLKTSKSTKNSTAGLIEVRRTTDAIDFLEWKTKRGAVKSTNRTENACIGYYIALEMETIIRVAA
ncbi:8327_t:CDS:2 [Funneliformis caledonium]|uniref:8327_t:CDS:1 n=1 Tax=Funneliformis caledonium TaxID=1117310 RepID=A0A9N9F434_9GLOM|nr:8327_t:CDS:2 [Funneliformis caledonium]